jgi:hypothetical protein
MGYDAPETRKKKATPLVELTTEVPKVEAPTVAPYIKRKPKEPEQPRALNQSLEERACSGLNYNYGSDKQQRERRRKPVSTGGF